MRDIAPFGLRMPHELKEQIEVMAKKNRRSMNAEIIVLLESTVQSNTCIDETKLRAIIKEELSKLNKS